jgi:hypothetical protein
MEKILIALKQEMIVNKKNSQPADGDMYWAQTNQWVWEFEFWVSKPYQQRILINTWRRFTASLHLYPYFWEMQLETNFERKHTRPVWRRRPYPSKGQQTDGKRLAREWDHNVTCDESTKESGKRNSCAPDQIFLSFKNVRLMH